MVSPVSRECADDLCQLCPHDSDGCGCTVCHGPARRTAWWEWAIAAGFLVLVAVVVVLAAIATPPPFA